jgi:hypothetical protein
MQTKPEFRRSERFGHEYIIKLGEDLRLSPYYAVSQNLNETGMRFKSIFELYPGSHIMIHIDDYNLDRNQLSARVVWCKKLENNPTFHFTVGVEFLQVEMNSGAKASLPAAPPRKTSGKKRGGVVIQMENRRPT